MRKLFLICLFIAVLAGGCQKTKAPQAKDVQTDSALVLTDFTVGDKVAEERLVSGFFEAHGIWRFTAQNFAVRVDVPQPIAATVLGLDLNVPAELIQVAPDVTLTCRFNGQEILKRKFTTSGRRFVEVRVPTRLLAKSPADIEFNVDHTFRNEEYKRDQGLIMVGVQLKHASDVTESDEAETTNARNAYQRLLRLRKMSIPEEKQNEMMKMFHELDVWKYVWFHGVQIEKNPLDLWMMQQIFWEQKPECVVETGTAFGGSALYWAHVLRDQGLEKSRVFTIDIEGNIKKASADPLWKNYVTFYKGSSTDPAIVQQIAGQVQGKRTIVTLDSDHSMQHVLREIKLYGQMVTSGSYLIVEDTHMDGVPTYPSLGPGPMAAVKRFLEEGGDKQFTQDLGREAFIMTFQPGGWLRKR
jgi:cephalosporin hydroxylase